MAMGAPATLDDDADYALDELEDLDERLARLRATKPAAWVRCFGRPAVLFTSYELVHAAFKDEPPFPPAAFYANTRTEGLGRDMRAVGVAGRRAHRAVADGPFLLTHL